MNKLFIQLKRLALFIMLPFFISCTSDNSNYCDALVEKSKNEPIKKLLLTWVNKNIANKKITESDVVFGGGMWPGFERLKVNFDWDALGVSEFSHIRLVRKIEGVGLNNVQSVFFGEKSRYGILVKVSGSSEFWIDKKYFSYSDNDIAVICREGD